MLLQHVTITSKRMDAVGIEPTTFHMCEDAKRLETLLVGKLRCRPDSNGEAYKSYPLESC